MRSVEQIAQELHDTKAKLRSCQARNGKKTTENINLQSEIKDIENKKCNNCGFYDGVVCNKNRTIIDMDGYRYDGKIEVFPMDSCSHWVNKENNYEV